MWRSPGATNAASNVAPVDDEVESRNRYFRASKLLLEVMGTYLRELFVKRWNERYGPQYQWKERCVKHPGARYEWVDDEVANQTRRGEYLVDGIENTTLIAGVTVKFKTGKPIAASNSTPASFKSPIEGTDFVVWVYSDAGILAPPNTRAAHISDDKVFGGGARCCVESPVAGGGTVQQVFEVVTLKEVTINENSPEDKRPTHSHELRLRFVPGQVARRDDVEKIVLGSRISVHFQSAFPSLERHVGLKLRLGRVAKYDITALNAIFCDSAHRLLGPDEDGRALVQGVKTQRNESYAHLSSCAMDVATFCGCVTKCRDFVTHFFSHDTLQEFEDTLKYLDQLNVCDNREENERLCHQLQAMMLAQQLDRRLDGIVRMPAEEQATLECYVPLNGSTTRHSDAHRDSEEAALEFVSRGAVAGSTAGRQDVMVVFAESGGGKTTFLKHLWRVLVDNYHQGGSSCKRVVPIFLSLPRVDATRMRSVVQDELTRLGLTDADMEKMADEDKQIVFLLDGYDEVSSDGGLNIIESCGVGVRLRNVQVIISCREDVLSGDPMHSFAPLRDR